MLVLLVTVEIEASGIVLTALDILLVKFMIRREEKQLEREFGEEWVRYRSQVRRWL